MTDDGQVSMFDLQGGRDAKVRGQRLASGGDDRQEYIRRARECLLREHPGEEFQMEQLWEWVGPPPSPYLMGALTTMLLRDGIIARTGRRVPMRKRQSHARKTDLYRVTSFPGGRT